MASLVSWSKRSSISLLRRSSVRRCHLVPYVLSGHHDERSRSRSRSLFVCFLIYGKQATASVSEALEACDQLLVHLNAISTELCSSSQSLEDALSTSSHASIIRSILKDYVAARVRGTRDIQSATSTLNQQLQLDAYREVAMLLQRASWFARAPNVIARQLFFEAAAASNSYDHVHDRPSVRFDAENRVLIPRRFFHWDIVAAAVELLSTRDRDIRQTQLSQSVLRVLQNSADTAATATTTALRLINAQEQELFLSDKAMARIRRHLFNVPEARVCDMLDDSVTEDERQVLELSFLRLLQYDNVLISVAAGTIHAQLAFERRIGRHAATDSWPLVIADGNCFYRSVVQESLPNTPRDYEDQLSLAIRRLSNEAKIRFDDIQSSMSVSASFSGFELEGENSNESGVWVDHLQIVRMAHYLRRPLWLVRYDDSGLLADIETGELLVGADFRIAEVQFGDRQPLLLVYTPTPGHYEALVPRKDWERLPAAVVVRDNETDAIAVHQMQLPDLLAGLKRLIDDNEALLASHSLEHSTHHMCELRVRETARRISRAFLLLDQEIFALEHSCFELEDAERELRGALVESIKQRAADIQDNLRTISVAVGRLGESYLRELHKIDAVLYHIVKPIFDDGILWCDGALEHLGTGAVSDLYRRTQIEFDANQQAHGAAHTHQQQFHTQQHTWPTLNAAISAASSSNTAHRSYAAAAAAAATSSSVSTSRAATHGRTKTHFEQMISGEGGTLEQWLQGRSGNVLSILYVHTFSRTR